jgi:hypothetical protein
VAGVLATTLAQTQVLARLPLQNLLKNELYADRTANAALFFWAGLAWYLKPAAGILTDAFPLFGNRRKSYILISAVLAALSWLALIVDRCTNVRMPGPAGKGERIPSRKTFTGSSAALTTKGGAAAPANNTSILRRLIRSSGRR